MPEQTEYDTEARCPGNLVDRADQFAARAHGSIDHRRKYLLTPYIEHPRAVATLLREHGEGEIAQAVALLHDVVEDTPVTIEEIDAVFGEAVSRRVALLTDEPAVPGRNRAARKAATRLRLSQADAITQSVKLADLIDNSVSIVAHDPQFARIFLREMRDLVEVLDRGNPRLRDLALERSAG